MNQEEKELVVIEATDHQYMGAAQEITGHVDAVFMLLGYCVIEEQGQVKVRTDREKARLAIYTRIFVSTQSNLDL